jgi:hypothetical protein
MSSGDQLEEAFLAVWRQGLLEGKQVVAVADATFPVLITPKQKLKQVDFQLDGRTFRGPGTKS